MLLVGWPAHGWPYRGWRCFPSSDLRLFHIEGHPVGTGGISGGDALKADLGPRLHLASQRGIECYRNVRGLSIFDRKDSFLGSKPRFRLDQFAFEFRDTPAPPGR